MPELPAQSGPTLGSRDTGGRSVVGLIQRDPTPCPDADVCQRCPTAADDDICLNTERRLFEDNEALTRQLAGAARAMSEVESAITTAVERGDRASLLQAQEIGRLNLDHLRGQ
jgi:hypothetical protein